MPPKNDLPESITLTYHLAELPTAQHKAGLAGLLLLIRNLQERKELGHVIGELPTFEHLPNGKVTLEFTPKGLQTVFDDFYDADSIETKKGKERPIPKGSYLRFWMGSTHDLWTKQLGDVLTSVMYSKPKSLNPFKARAAKGIVPKAKELYEHLAAPQHDEKASQEVKGQHFIGAAEENAERVSFATKPSLFLLLHFWILASPVFVPRMLIEERDAQTGERYLEGKLNDPSRGIQAQFLLAIPDIADLDWFLDGMREYWRSLTGSKTYYRPAEAVIDVLEQGGLEMMFRLAEYGVSKFPTGSSLLAAELYHLRLEGKGPVKSVRVLSAGRLRPDPAMLEEYQTHLRDSHANPLFKRLAIGNLIAGRPWHAAAQSLLANYPAEYFIGKPAKARFRPFGYDTRKRFNILIEQLKLLERHKETTMTDIAQTQLNDALARRVYQMIGAYVRHRTKEKCSKDVDDFPKDQNGHRSYPTEYREAREKVSKEAFLALRGRREGDIAEYFTGSLCAVPQFLKEDDFIVLSRALIEKPEQVKDLAMLALSAHAYLPGQKTDDQADANSAD